MHQYIHTPEHQYALHPASGASSKPRTASPAKKSPGRALPLGESCRLLSPPVTQPRTSLRISRRPYIVVQSTQPSPPYPLCLCVSVPLLLSSKQATSQGSWRARVVGGGKVISEGGCGRVGDHPPIRPARDYLHWLYSLTDDTPRRGKRGAGGVMPRPVAPKNSNPDSLPLLLCSVLVNLGARCRGAWACLAVAS